MIIYLEHKAKDYPLTKHILAYYKDARILIIDHYKNIFDKKPLIPIGEKAIILAKHEGNALSPTPKKYEYDLPGYFFKTSLNCPFSCRYCYLKGAFRNPFITIFVNYDDIAKQIQKAVHTHAPQKVLFYSSDYSDILALDTITKFCDYFLPFFDTLSNAYMEIRSKSHDISSIIQRSPAKNTEICFSINPQEIIQNYELWTPPLSLRLSSATKLAKNWWKVGLRIMPLLPVKNYQTIYTQFISEIQKYDLHLFHSIIYGGLLYTSEDYRKMLQKEPYLDVLYHLEKSSDNMYRLKRETRAFFDTIFEQIPGARVCFEE